MLKKYKNVRTKLNEAKANLGISHSHKSSQLFSVWSDLWLEHKTISVKQSTYVRYKNSLDLHIKPKLGCFKIQLINTERLQQFFNEAANSGRMDHSGGLSSCVEKDFEIKSLSVILGHSSVKITLDKYVHVTMQMKRNNMSKVKLAV